MRRACLLVVSVAFSCTAQQPGRGGGSSYHGAALEGTGGTEAGVRQGHGALVIEQVR